MRSPRSRPDTTRQSLDWLSRSERSRLWGFRFRLGEWRRDSVLVVPCLYLSVVLAIAAVMAAAEGNGDALGLEINDDTARTVLSAIAGGMIAFTGLVVSIAVVVVQFAAGQYSPRLVARFRRDPVFKHSLGIFIAPAVYSLVVLRDVGRAGSSSAPSLTIGIAFVLLGIAIIAFFVLVGRLLDLLRPRKLIGRLLELGAHSATEVYPFRLGKVPAEADGHERDPAEVLSYEGPPAVLVAIDRGGLVRLAERSDVLIELTVGVGSYLPRAAPIFRVHRHAGSGTVDEDAVGRCLVTGSGRTITQDPAFAIRAMVDIAAKALSPAVNDPTTAVEVLDGLESMLFAVAWRDLDRGRIADRQGRVRLVFPNPGWDQLLDLSLTEIGIFGAGSPQVTRRLSALLGDLERHAPDERQPGIAAARRRFEAVVSRAVEGPSEFTYATTQDRLGIGTV